ncbi:VWA domain-containing protein [Tenacibaculum sp.]|nr:VWA domain-containing protein [Tenacibaculum sp.]
MKSTFKFPFSAILGQEDFKLCLQLTLIDPSIGGVLATGDKGTGKTTTVRALSQLMGEEFPFVNLPIGATEDRVLGSVNLEALINQKKTIIDKGLLAKAHQGFLYIDEVNLLNDYLMDVLLDASSSGGYHLEREGISQWLDSQFCLVGTMNPEEGELRPQLIDRFGLSVTINTPKEKSLRKKIAMQRLTFDSNSEVFYKDHLSKEQTTKKQILKAKVTLASIQIPDNIQELAAQLTLDNNVEGMRADILLLKTVRAYAAYLGKSVISEEMLHKITPFVLQHRSKEYTPPNKDNNTNDDNSSDSNQENKETEQTEQQAASASFQLPESVKKGLHFSITQNSKKKEVKLDSLESLKTVPFKSEQQQALSLIKTVKNYIISQKFSPIYQDATKKAIARIVFLVDTSASMALDKQLGYIKGTIQKTIEKHPLQKVQYAIVGLEGSSAKIIQHFTSNSSIVTDENYKLTAGGKTNLGAAFFKVFELLKSIPKKTVQLFILTDGKANTGGNNPFEYAIDTYKTYLSKLSNSTIIDTENSFVKLKKAQQLAQRLQLRYIPLSSL